MLRTCRQNIAHNTLPYKFARMLPLPQIGREVLGGGTAPEEHGVEMLDIAHSFSFPAT